MFGGIGNFFFLAALPETLDGEPVEAGGTVGGAGLAGAGEVGLGRKLAVPFPFLSGWCSRSLSQYTIAWRIVLCQIDLLYALDAVSSSWYSRPGSLYHGWCVKIMAAGKL